MDKKNTNDISDLLEGIKRITSEYLPSNIRGELENILKQVNQKFRDVNSQVITLQEMVEDMFKELEEVYKVSITDQLTGFLNRAGFDKEMNNYLKISKKTNSPIALYMVDINNLKFINDKYGHSGGDILIKHIKSSIEEVLNDSEYEQIDKAVGRWGGDEFSIALMYNNINNMTFNNMTYGNRACVGENIMKKLKERDLLFGEESRKASVSIGKVVYYPEFENIYLLPAKDIKHKIFESLEIRTNNTTKNEETERVENMLKVFDTCNDIDIYDNLRKRLLILADIAAYNSKWKFYKTGEQIMKEVKLIDPKKIK